MTSPAAPKRARPMSPHLQIYRPQMTSGLSIFHRLTGIALAFGLPVFVVWLMALAKNEKAYDCVLTMAHSMVGKVMLAGWTWAFCFHLCMGVRHLFWDMGLFLDIKSAYKTGYVALIISTGITMALWCKFLWIDL